MSEFWVDENNLDEAQKAATKGIDINSSFLIRGPAGSGKTNILLLRGVWLKFKAMSDFRIVVFTSSLKEFIQRGAGQYKIPSENVVTAFQLFKEILEEYGQTFTSMGDFETDRSLLAGQVKALMEERSISDVFPALLVDESQDYSETELEVFRRLTPRLVLACDTRQSIYKTTAPQTLLEQLVGSQVVDLKYHYRTGLRLCNVADAILRDSRNFPPISGECRYDEETRPSSLEVIETDSFDQQVQTIIKLLPGHLELYGGTTIGVLFPKKEQQQYFLSAFDRADFLGDKSKVKVDTLHGSKGWEFQAVHIGGCETLSRMGPIQKRLIYTGILRARTSVNIYHSGPMPGYLDSAIATVSPPKEDPTLGDLFGG